MTDQELLVYAAKAVGLEDATFVGDSSWGWGIAHKYDQYVLWNPLLSDAGAFRLMVKLALSVYPPQGADPAAVVEDWKWDIRITEVDEDGDYLTTTRRAIVRAAAEIGRNMTE